MGFEIWALGSGVGRERERARAHTHTHTDIHTDIHTHTHLVVCPHIAGLVGHSERKALQDLVLPEYTSKRDLVY